MVWDELARDARDENQRDRDKWIGVYIGILAVILAVCSMLGGNAAKEATQRNIEAANTWAFFQAKNVRRHILRIETDRLELQLAADAALAEPAKAAIHARIADYKRQDAVLTADPDKPAATREGLDQLWEKAKRLEAERDLAMRRDPYFDYGQALLQIAIVLASIAIISGGGGLLAVSFLLGAAGTLLTLNGQLLLVAIPGMG
jgi:hypothetical protein